MFQRLTIPTLPTDGKGQLYKLFALPTHAGDAATRPGGPPRDDRRIARSQSRGGPGHRNFSLPLAGGRGVLPD
ncbi:hypothetical protein SBV1_270003 [Verrucomicrobia bacterium]|nr:hypothetical protein SBV1_270003 [Verrucomicrobiota bacterium]